MNKGVWDDSRGERAWERERERERKRERERDRERERGSGSEMGADYDGWRVHRSSSVRSETWQVPHSLCTPTPSAPHPHRHPPISLYPTQGLSRQGSSHPSLERLQPINILAVCACCDTYWQLGVKKPNCQRRPWPQERVVCFTAGSRHRVIGSYL